MASSHSHRTSPASRPASQADVKKARAEGVAFGLNMALNMMLWCLSEKQNATTEQIQDLNKELHELAAHITVGRISIKDIESALHEEHHIDVEYF